MRKHKSNALLGSFGALLGACLGSAVYYMVTKLGFVAVISSLAGTLASLLLYSFFGRRLTAFGIALSILLNVAALFLTDTYIIADRFVESSANLTLGYDLPYVMHLKLQELLRGEAWADYKYALFSLGFTLFGGLAAGFRILDDQRRSEEAAQRARQKEE